MSKSIVFSAKNAVVRKELNTILSGINIELAQGELVALVGSAGSGKTTLGQLVSGEIDAYERLLRWWEFFGSGRNMLRS